MSLVVMVEVDKAEARKAKEPFSIAPSLLLREDRVKSSSEGVRKRRLIKDWLIGPLEDRDSHSASLLF